ncbi:extracellular calcium-sensing receptor-like [Polypterus senegalus]|uniref:extracellular calcium-sensing receptor-like n=1 Tax=Polypterus senegalus TaxID=55291 RepID=UPI001966BEFC|nr:extracellular calcium-sensing receptor-like [Polypterus senegalus]
MALAVIVLSVYFGASLAGGASETKCTLLKAFTQPSIFQDGDIILGGLFHINFKVIVNDLSYQMAPELSECENFNFRSFRWAQTMIYAIEEINRDSTLLPNIRLGYKIHDSCGKHPFSLRGAFSLISGQKQTQTKLPCTGFSGVHAIIGDPSSTQTITLSRTLAPFGIPVVSYYATCACLSNRKEFPNFFRTIPSDFYQARAMAQLAKRFSWTWIGTISSDDEYGRLATQTFAEELLEANVCMAFSETVSKIYPRQDALRIVNIIKKSLARVIVVFSGDMDVEPLFLELAEQNITNRQFLASEAWSNSPVLSNKEISAVTRGVLGIAIQKAEIPGLWDFLVSLHPSKFPGNTFVERLWEESFNCRLALENVTVVSSSGLHFCNGSESLSQVQNSYTDVSQLRITYNVYKAVYAHAHALHDLQACQNGSGPLQNNTCADIFTLQPWQLLYYMTKVHFRTKVGDQVYFDENGDPIAAYDIINWQMSKSGILEFINVGHINGSELYINDTAIIWADGTKKVPQSVCSTSCPPGTRKAIRKGEPICCFDCIVCAEGEISETADSLQCIKCHLEFWSNTYRNECVPREIEFLSFQDTMGITLTAVTLSGTCLTLAIGVVFLYYKNTPIVRANNSELSFLLLISLGLCFLCSLFFIGQPSEWSCIVRHAAFGVSFVLCISCILVKTIVVLMAFQATLPGNDIMKWFGPSQQRGSVFVSTLIQVLICVIWLATTPPVVYKNNGIQSSKIILECTVGSAAAFGCVLGYIGLLGAICFVLAFLARNLPDNFNEAKFITFSMLIFCAVWITFIPAYVSSPGKYTVAVEIFAILSSSYGLLGCIFAPKCYIILLRPDQNTKKHVMGRAVSSIK